MTRSFLALAAACMVASLGMASRAAQDGQAKTPEPPKQVHCPMAPDVEIDPEVFTEYEGQRVYFCCDRCRTTFVRNPEKYAARLVTVAPGISPPTGRDEHQPAQEHAPEHAPMARSAANQADTDHHHNAEDSKQAPSAERRADKAPTDHDHGTHEHGSGPRWLNWLGRFHPPMTAFPIGVLVAGAVAEALFLIRRRPELDHVARYCVAFAAVTGIVTGILGWFFAGIRLTDTDALLGIHRWLGTATALWLVVLLWASERARRPAQAPSPTQARARGWYRFLLFTGTALVLTTGFFGGSMVYGLDHFALP